MFNFIIKFKLKYESKKLFMKYLLLITLFFNLFQLNAGDETELPLRRSEEVIKEVKTVLDVAICASTHEMCHSSCRIARCTQKCPSCRQYDIYFIDQTVAIDTTLKPCILCNNKLHTIFGFPRKSSVESAR